MQISIANAILVARLIGKSIVTACLQMFLPFKTIQQLAEELIVNGDFATDSDWSKGVGWSISGGVASSDGTQTGLSYLNQSGAIVSGKTYKATFEVVSISAGEVRIFVGSVENNSPKTTTGVYTEYMTAASTSFWIRASSTFVGSITNVSVKEVAQFSPDETINNNDAKLLTGNCLNFDGTNDYLDIDGFTMSGTNATFAFWINSNDTTPSSFIFEANTQNLVIGFNSSQLSIFSGGWDNFGVLPPNVWSRVIITCNGTTAKCFVNGVQLGVDKTIAAINLSSASEVKIGSRFNGGSLFFDGQLSDFQIWNAVWSATDVANDYAKPNEVVSSVPAINLVGYWAMTEGNGGLAYDSSSLLSAEKVINGDFEIGSELVTNGDFATDSDWTKRNGSTINDVANVIAGGTIGGSTANWSLESLANVFEPSKTYQIKFKAKQVSLAGSNAGAFQVGNSFGALFDEVITSEFVEYTFTAQASSNNWPKLTIGGRIAGDVFQIDNISVKEVFPNWTISGTDATHFVESASGGGARYVSGTTSPVLALRQDALTSGKTFQVSCNVAYTGSGKVRCSIGGVNLPPFEEGANTRTATAGSAIFQFLRNDINVDAVITNLSILQVTPADNGAITNGATWLLRQSTIPQLGMMDWSKGTNQMTNSDGFNAFPWSGENVTVTTGQIAPDGTLTAMKIVNGSTDGYRILTGIVVNSNVRSIYARTVSGTGTVQLLTHNTNSGNLFTLTTEWQRVSAQVNSSIGQGNFYAVDFRGSSTTLDEVVLWGAQIDNGTTVGNFRKTSGTAVTNAILPPYPVNPTTDVLGNLLRDRQNSLNLTGTGYAEVADDNSLDFGTGDFTLECWVIIDGNTDRRLLDKRNTTSGYTLYLTSLNVLKLELNDGTGNSNFVLTNSLSSNTWLHLAVVCDRSANATCYINKAAQTPVSISSKNGSIDSTSNLFIGADAPSGVGLFSTDIIGDVRLYCKALTADEVLQNYLVGLPAHPNLVKSTADAFKLRVLADGGVFESYTCLETQLTTLNNIS